MFGTPGSPPSSPPASIATSRPQEVEVTYNDSSSDLFGTPGSPPSSPPASIATSRPQEVEITYNDSSSDLFGTPGSPPASIATSRPQEVEITDIEPTDAASQQWRQKKQQPQQNTCKIDKMDELYGIDSDALQYELEDEVNFVMNDGTLLSGEALISSLKKFNTRLSKKVNLYRSKCEELQKSLNTIERETSSKVENIRTFYRNMLYYSNSRGEQS